MNPIQVDCIRCQQVILTPVVTFKKDEEKRVIGNHCCWCGEGILFILKKNGRVGLEKRGIVNIDCKSFVYKEKDIGQLAVRGTTEIVLRKNKDEWEARIGIAIFGGTNVSWSIGANPFDPYFCDNYAIGKGKSESEAVEALKNDIKRTSNGLFDM